jgi:hypothetical protein
MRCRRRWATTANSVSDRVRESQYSFVRSVAKGARAVFLTGLAVTTWTIAAYLSPQMPSLLIMVALQWALIVAWDWTRHRSD